MPHNFKFKELIAFRLDNFIKWIKIVYRGTKSTVKVNYFQTLEFSIQRGDREGCPISALLYFLCVEVLSIETSK